MSEAIFALLGAAIGVLGTLLTEITRSTQEDKRTHRQALRNDAADFAGRIAIVQRLSKRMHSDPGDAILRERLIEEHALARVCYERLRITADSLTAQETARRLMYQTQRLIESIDGPHAEFDVEDGTVGPRLVNFYQEIRRELGLRHASDVYADPPGGLIP